MVILFTSINFHSSLYPIIEIYLNNISRVIIALSFILMVYKIVQKFAGGIIFCNTLYISAIPSFVKIIVSRTPTNASTMPAFESQLFIQAFILSNDAFASSICSSTSSVYRFFLCRAAHIKSPAMRIIYTVISQSYIRNTSNSPRLAGMSIDDIRVIFLYQCSNLSNRL